MSCVIYKITYNDTVIYIGSTVNFKSRIIIHKFDYDRRFKTPIYEYIRLIGGWDCVEFERICYCPIDKDTRDRYESSYIMLYKDTVKNVVIPGRSKKEYHEVNREQNLIKFKEHYQDNKEQILIKRKERIPCICGTPYPRGHKTHHMRSKKHLNNI